MTRAIVLFASLVSLGACAGPTHLQYDFGRAYMTTFRVQADLTRPSVANQSYGLYGPEAAAIRLNVEATVTESKSADETTVEN